MFEEEVGLPGSLSSEDRVGYVCQKKLAETKEAVSPYLGLVLCPQPSVPALSCPSHLRGFLKITLQCIVALPTARCYHTTDWLEF